jgi:hypothetical protein
MRLSKQFLKASGIWTNHDQLAGFFRGKISDSALAVAPPYLSKKPIE